MCMTLKRWILRGALALTSVVVIALNAHALPVSDWADEEQVSARLIAATSALGTDGNVLVGLEFQLQPGWKVYWRSPGDAGFPPMLDFTGSENVEASDLQWPLPSRFSVIGLETLGYEGAVVLPFKVTAIDPRQDAKINVQLRYLTCKEICIPYDATLSLTLPTGDATPSPLAHIIGQFQARVPRTADAARFDVDRLWTETSAKGLYLAADVSSVLKLKGPELFVEGPAGFGYGAPLVEMAEGATRATLRVPVSGYKGTPAEAAASLTGTPFTLTISDGKRAAELTLDAGPPQTFDPSALNALPAPTIDASQSIWLMLTFAFLGGLILNLMPCVLPVLSIKLLSLVKHGGATTGAVRASFMMTSAGIITAFMGLAAALIGLKAIGAGIGWGIQFQQPWFLIAMAFLVTLFACNLWGFFEFRLPGAVSDRAAKAGARPTLFAPFVQGMFATLLATPCSAPFLGTAVGFALAGGDNEILMIFAMLGVGLSTPYLVVAAFPKIATKMPKPGAWMVKLRFVFGLALAATAVWLLTIVDSVSGPVVAISTGVILIGVSIWMGPVMHRVPEIRKATPFVLLLASLGAVTSSFVGGINGPLDPEQPQISKVNWKRFDIDTLTQLVNAGHLVLVDVTADWCITCQVNKRLVLEDGRILEMLNGPDVIPLRADWTRPDPEIAEYLASFGRYGIPFNAIYGPRAKGGVALPELLSERNVLDGFKQVVPESMTARFE